MFKVDFCICSHSKRKKENTIKTLYLVQIVQYLCQLMFCVITIGIIACPESMEFGQILYK